MALTAAALQTIREPVTLSLLLRGEREALQNAEGLRHLLVALHLSVNMLPLALQKAALYRSCLKQEHLCGRSTPNSIIENI